MALSAFDDKSKTPSRGDLTDVLGDAIGMWNQIIVEIGSRFYPLAQDWGFSGKNWGWGLRLKHKKRAVLYLTPSNGFFYAGFALGQKAVDQAHDSDLPPSILEAIDSPPKYAEGRGVRLEVRSDFDVRAVTQLADIKMAN
ncbi:MAG: DUF3788 family protein [Acidobacteriota bacterium]|nr:DUF3788 family protein [Acidobacteriota bacterium]